MEDIGPPPSYDAVVSDPLPSAPPPQEFPPPLDPVHYQREPPQPPPPLGGPASVNQPLNQPSSGSAQSGTSRLRRFVNVYTSYSVPRQLRKYIQPKEQRLDPELDVEAQFSRRAVREAQSKIAKSTRLQCISGWLWCIGCFSIFLYLSIPIAMLVTGIVGFHDCPHNSDTIIVYLLLGGSLMTALLLFRLVPSVMTCFRNRNYLDTARSGSFTACICIFELLFYLLVAANFVVLVLGSVWIFQDTSVPTCSPIRTQDCCHTYVYVVSAFFNVFQYVMYIFTAVYVCLVVSCIRNMNGRTNSRR